MVSAQDVGRKPQLVLGKQFKYMPSAWGTKDLKRHVYLNGYTDLQLYDYHFELDDDLPQVGLSAEELGLVLRHILANATLPVLMAH